MHRAGGNSEDWKMSDITGRIDSSICIHYKPQLLAKAGFTSRSPSCEGKTWTRYSYFNLGGGTDDSTKHNEAFLHSGIGMNLIILDPELCMTTTPYHWLSTAVRSLDHCVEALCSLQDTETSDRNAEEGLNKWKDVGASHSSHTYRGTLPSTHQAPSPDVGYPEMLERI
ncbi:hypothetical protein AYO21_09529 [Fonsecaea monophora]|uniref:Uncharacterized protein n=1 Tax=Fonsecaea monophora TaxID=254056 RepID=A0A177EW67_9EURO|nr:hypothetical protein AYO21_09529 [Fonsecaea monophora]OAG36287.1 hypothetical protein AYO21_09529 [Fonsecaea monophora]